MREITKQWLEFAKADLKSCENNISDSFLTNIVAFHAQQTVEKCFKAIIEENNLKVERTHSLFKLVSSIKKFITFNIDIDNIELLDKIYTSSRYPGEVGLFPNGKPSVEESKQLYAFAMDIYNMTIQMLS